MVLAKLELVSRLAMALETALVEQGLETALVEQGLEMALVELESVWAWV
jgi:hypothetical protein